MRLTTEEMGNLPEADAATLDEVLGYDAFGKFAILSKSDEEFIQTGCDWRPDKATEAFLAATGSDPWVLEYREGGRVEGHVTLEQVRQAFQSYLAGGQEWRTGSHGACWKCEHRGVLSWAALPKTLAARPVYLG
jgi:hypothetical protein